MGTSRRQFLKGLFAIGGAIAIGTIIKKRTKPLETKSGKAGILLEKYASPKTELVPKKTKSVVPKDVQLLMDCFFPILKLNEGEKFYFYLCAKDNITVGYGTNFEENPHWFHKIHLYHNGKKLSMEESIKAYIKMKKFSTNLAEKRRDLDKKKITEKEYKRERKLVETKIAKYTIQPQDAKKLADRGMRYFIGQLERKFKNPKTNQSCFFDLPFCMQGVALDIIYQIGPERFDQYKKFKAALINRDFEAATKESKVYIDKKKKTVSLNRERRKKRLLRVMKIAQANKNNPMGISDLIKADYMQNVPKWSIRKTAKGIPYPYKEREINMPFEAPCEIEMAKGELEHMKLCRARAISAVRPQEKNNQDSPLKTRIVVSVRRKNTQGR